MKLNLKLNSRTSMDDRTALEIKESQVKRSQISNFITETPNKLDGSASLHRSKEEVVLIGKEKT